jgi:hypothetical protein
MIEAGITTKKSADDFSGWEDALADFLFGERRSRLAMFAHSDLCKRCLFSYRIEWVFICNFT